MSGRVVLVDHDYQRADIFFLADIAGQVAPSRTPCRRRSTWRRTFSSRTSSRVLIASGASVTKADGSTPPPRNPTPPDDSQINSGTAAVVAALVALLWFALPATLGGQTSYISTHGNSMEPMFQTGDLAVLRPAKSYQVGDVVLYRSETVDAEVMHRIVDVQDGQFILQGDTTTGLTPIS